MKKNTSFFWFLFGDFIISNIFYKILNLNKCQLVSVITHWTYTFLHPWALWVFEFYHSFTHLKCCHHKAITKYFCCPILLIQLFCHHNFRAIFFSRLHFRCTWPSLLTEKIRCLLSLSCLICWEYFLLCIPYCSILFNTEKDKVFFLKSFGAI